MIGGHGDISEAYESAGIKALVGQDAAHPPAAELRAEILESAAFGYGRHTAFDGFIYACFRVCVYISGTISLLQYSPRVCFLKSLVA